MIISRMKTCESSIRQHEACAFRREEVGIIENDEPMVLEGSYLLNGNQDG